MYVHCTELHLLQFHFVHDGFLKSIKHSRIQDNKLLLFVFSKKEFYKISRFFINRIFWDMNILWLWSILFKKNGANQSCYNIFFQHMIEVLCSHKTQIFYSVIFKLSLLMINTVLKFSFNFLLNNQDFSR